MQVYDKVNKTELTADTDELIKLMAPGGRQVDLYLKEKKSDEDGYMTWDVEHWSSVDGRRFYTVLFSRRTRIKRIHRT